MNDPPEQEIKSIESQEISPTKKVAFDVFEDDEESSSSVCYQEDSNSPIKDEFNLTTPNFKKSAHSSNLTNLFNNLDVSEEVRIS